jgi:hypothetical protein
MLTTLLSSVKSVNMPNMKEPIQLGCVWMGVLTWMGHGRPHCTYVWCAGKGGQSGHRSEYSLQILDVHVRSNQSDGAAHTVVVHSRYLLSSSHDSSPPIHSPSHNSLVPLSLSLSQPWWWCGKSKALSTGCPASCHPRTEAAHHSRNPSPPIQQEQRDLHNVR